MICKTCKKTPKEIPEYRQGAFIMGITPDIYVEREEVTYNSKTKEFLCTSCYIKHGVSNDN